MERTGSMMYRQLLTAIGVSVSVASAQHGALQTVERGGKPVATYYAVEPHLRTALAQISEYFPRFSGQSFRLWVDCLLPIDLKELGYEPAEVITQRWVREFFRDQHPETGLIPLGGPPRPSRPLYTILDQSKCMFMRTIDQATLFMPWVGDDKAYRGRCVTLAEGFMKHFRVSIHHGLFSAVRADTGFPESAFTNVTYYGSATVGLARIGVAAKRQDLLDRAKHIAQWVSDFSVRYCRGIVPEKFHAAGGFPNDLSSDGIYWVRAMGRAYAATGDEFYRDLAHVCQLSRD